MKIMNILREGYTKLTEQDDATFATSSFKDTMLSLYSKLIEYYKGDRSLEKDATPEEIGEMTDLAIKIANYIYHNFGDIGEVVDDGAYDELVYLYRTKTKKFLFGAPNRRKSVEIKHSYPQLKGTLSKVRYVYKDEAESAGKTNDSLQEFLEKYFDTSYSENGKKIICAISLKYDGISAVVDMKDGKIEQILTRGDNQMGADITATFPGYKFPQLEDTDFMENNQFGIQCEAVFKKNKLEEYNRLSGKTYANARSAMVGISSSFENAIDCTDFVTLMPIALSERPKKCVSRCDELQIINDCIDMRTEWICISGYSIHEILEKFNMFKDQFLAVRDQYDYMVDGLVVEFTEYMVRAELGRTNDINNFAIAYKFPSQSKSTEVLDVTYSVGRTGEVVPKVHYKPVYFNGGEFKKTTLANITNFKLMDLKPGDVINVQYSNDVLCYVTKDHMNPINLNNKNTPFEFPRECPCCGKPLSLLQKDGLKIYCTNEDCPSRVVETMVNFITKLNIKDLGSETIQYLYDAGLVKSIADLYRFDASVLDGHDGFGAKKISIIQDAIDSILNRSYKDYEVFGALGIRSVGVTLFQPICKRFEFENYVRDSFIPGIFELQLGSMKGFGPKRSALIYYELTKIMGDLELLRMLKSMNIEYTYSDKIEDELREGVKVCFSGIRDEQLELAIGRFGGFVVNSVNKETDILIVKDATTKSTKADKARKYGVEVISHHIFKDNYLDILEEHSRKYN